MGFPTASHQHRSLAAFADQSDQPDELVIPDDLTALPGEELDNLHEQANDAFNAIYNDAGDDITDEQLEQLEALESGIGQLRAEQDRRASEKAERSDKAKQIAARVQPADEPEQPEGDADGDGEQPDGDNEVGEVTAEAGHDTETGGDVEVDTTNVPDDASSITETQPEPIAASGKPKRRGGSTRVNLSGIRANQSRTPRPQASNPQSMTDIVTAAPDMPGFANGQGMDWSDIGRGINRRLGAFNETIYKRAQREGNNIRQQNSVAVFRKPFDPDLIVASSDPAHVDTVMDRAVNEARLPGGSLVASGGWCAPSTTVYDLCNLTSRDGMLAIPEIQVDRGGINYASSPSFADVFDGSGFCYTEDEDAAGDYDGDGGGEKPCAEVPCPDFTEYRLNLCGTCVTSGVLQARGYPEALADFTQKVMVAHEHRVNKNVIQEIITNSTPVAWPAPQAGATAPLLSAVEFNVELIKQGERMSRGTSMEAVFPFWVRGVIRADLSRRLGVDLIDVPDARINAWFTQRGISPQFVYDWQDLDTTSTAYPDSIDILLYPAGSFVKGTEDVISLDTVYDSTQLGQNNFTALFFEEGWLVAKRCGESRAVSVPICPNGSTNAGELIGCDGTSSGSAS